MNEVGKLDISWIQGFTRDNVQFVNNKTVCYKCGNHICFLNVETKTRSVFQSPGRGVGALTACGRNGTFALSDRKQSPSIFVYNFPELNLNNELKGNAELDYTSLTLSCGGPYLAACSSLPDYSITVWNWENAEVMCTQSQVGQDVISLAFNPLNWFQLCALGTTTLTLWSIERCGRFHQMTPSAIQLPACNGSFSEEPPPTPTKSFIPESSLSTKATITPSAICWTATSQLYVGCAEGYLLLIDPDNLSVSILFNPTTADALPKLQNFYFQALTLKLSHGLIAVGKESVIHCLQIKGTQIRITQTWQLDRPVSTAVVSPDNSKLLLSANTGQIYLLNPDDSGHTEKVLDVRSGNFLTATLLCTDRMICVSLREGGVLELWSSYGTCLSSLDLQTEVASLACCPIAHYAAVGTASGKVLFFDLNREDQLRLVHEVSLYHSAVDHLVFDQEGHYLLCSGSDLHLYVLHARPSNRFSVIGYIEVPGYVLSLSTLCFGSSERVKVIVLCTSQEDENNDDSLLLVFSLPFKNIAGPEYVNRNGCLYTVKVFRHKVPHPLTSCVLGVGEVFAYCLRKKSLQRFQLPELDTDYLFRQDMVPLKLKEEVMGHPFGPASLLLSPDCKWLASVGRDGLLRITPTSSMEQYCELWCHSGHFGGIGSVSFSEDCHTVVTTGFKDGSLLWIKLRTKDSFHKTDNGFTQYRQAIAKSMETAIDSENSILICFPVWGQETPVSCKTTEETGVSYATSIDVTEQDESYLPTASSSTWLESRQEEIMKEDNEQYSETKKKLRETIKKLRHTIQIMLRENESLPEEQFNLDLDEQKKLEAMVEEEANRVKAKIEQDIIEKLYLRDVLKRECWDSMMIKPRMIKAFHSEMAVKNYPLKERTETVLEDLRRVQNMRKIEKATWKLISLKKSISEQEGEQEEEEQEAESGALNGSLSAQLGYTSPYIYNQFSLQTIEHRINQIILLQDLIYAIKLAFNSDFEALLKQKLQELRRLQDRNKNIRAIMQELDIKLELWEPSLNDDEWPERVLIVDDSEIKAEKYLTPEQKLQEERERLERESRLAAQGDDSRERALDDMMDGVLEVKKVDILKVEIPLPEFVLDKPDIQWSEEEKKIYKEYEKNVKELNEEKEKYKRGLEIEMKKLQESIKEATEKFDESLIMLFKKKIQCTIAIYQEELKITYLADSVDTVEEMNSEEQEIKLKLEQLLANKMETEKDLMRYEDEVEQFQYAYESIVTEDKLLDSEFRKGFAELPKHMADQLYKLFKRRPRVQRVRRQSEMASNLFRRYSLNSLQASDGLSQMLTAMEELDGPENIPKGLPLSIWERFCVARRTKVESEHKMKIKALNLAEMQAFLQKRRNEDNAAQEEIIKHFKALRSLRNNRNQHLMNTTVQVVLPQGQVEMSTTDWTSDTAKTDFIVLHRSVIDNLKENIRRLAEQKVTFMEARRDIRKDIIQLEWEHRVMNTKIQNLNDKKKDMKMLKLSKEDMKCLGKDQNTHIVEKITMLEKSITFMKQTHQRSIQQRMKKIKRMNKKMAKIEESSAAFKRELPHLHVTVSELTHVYEAAATEENEAKEREERYKEIIKRRNLEDLARSQSDELDVLWKEVERLERRNFPSLDLLNYNS